MRGEDVVINTLSVGEGGVNYDLLVCVCWESISPGT